MLVVPILELHTIDMTAVQVSHFAGNHRVSFALVERCHKSVTGVQVPIARHIHTDSTDNLLGRIVALSIYLYQITLSVLCGSCPLPSRSRQGRIFYHLRTIAITHMGRCIRSSDCSFKTNLLSGSIHRFIADNLPTQVTGDVHHAGYFTASGRFGRFFVVGTAPACGTCESECQYIECLFHYFLMIVTFSVNSFRVMLYSPAEIFHVRSKSPIAIPASSYGALKASSLLWM